MKINFARIVGILSYILCSEIIHHFREIFNVTLGVGNATEGSFFFWWWKERSMQIVWRLTCPTIHKIKFHLSDIPLV